MSKSKNKTKINEKLELAKQIHAITYNLDVYNKEHQKIIIEQTKIFVKAVEGIRLKAYKDLNGYLTIGYGFNLQAEGAEAEFNEILKNAVDSSGNKLDFERVKRKE